MDNDSKIHVFFDVDHTLVNGSTGSLYVKFLYEKKFISLFKVLQVLCWDYQYKLNLLNRDKFSNKILKWLEGTSESKMRQINREFVYTKLQPFLYSDALKIVSNHQKQGHEVVLFSALPNYTVEPIGELIKVDKFVCTELEVENGQFPGHFKEPFCYGDGKLKKLLDYAKSNHLNLERCFIYTDSIVDLPSLKAVGNPVVVNPDKFLKKEARKRGWQEVNFKQ